MGGSQSHQSTPPTDDVALPTIKPDPAAELAATRVQAALRGHLSRKDSLLVATRGVLAMRTNLPADWRAETGVPAGLEIEQRRFLSFLGTQLLVSYVHVDCWGNPTVGACDRVVPSHRVAKVCARPSARMRARARARRVIAWRSRRRASASANVARRRALPLPARRTLLPPAA